MVASADGKSLWAARILLNDVVRVDLATGAVTRVVPVGVHPYRPILAPDGSLIVADVLPPSDSAIADAVAVSPSDTTTTITYTAAIANPLKVQNPAPCLRRA